MRKNNKINPQDVKKVYNKSLLANIYMQYETKG